MGEPGGSLITALARKFESSHPTSKYPFSVKGAFAREFLPGAMQKKMAFDIAG